VLLGRSDEPGSGEIIRPNGDHFAWQPGTHGAVPECAIKLLPVLRPRFQMETRFEKYDDDIDVLDFELSDVVGGQALVPRSQTIILRGFSRARVPVFSKRLLSVCACSDGTS